MTNSLGPDDRDLVGLNVLMVDDEPTALRLVQGILYDTGAAVVTTAAPVSYRMPCTSRSAVGSSSTISTLRPTRSRSSGPKLLVMRHPSRRRRGSRPRLPGRGAGCAQGRPA